MKILRKTKSVCPVCLKNVDANLIKAGLVRADSVCANAEDIISNAEGNFLNDEIILSKVCEEHGKFETVVWRGEPNFETWGMPKTQNKNTLQALEFYTESSISNPFPEQFSGQLSKQCPHNCGLCSQHEQRTCTVLLELTHVCNLHCPVCFANATNVEDSKSIGKISKSTDFLSLDKVREQLAWIHKQAGSIVLQLSGGEPTLYPHLIDVVQTASQLFGAVQLNSNGLLLAQDEHLAKKLKEAGLSWVFLQCDGDTDAVHVQLRGQALLDTKIKAIENCKKAGLSVVLVSVVAAGVNDEKLGDMLRFGLSFFPTVRGVHFQPMTLSGRNSFHESSSHITLPEVITKLSQQSHGMIKVAHALPSSCEHALCSFHCRYYVNADGKLQYIRAEADCACDIPVARVHGKIEAKNTASGTANSDAKDDDRFDDAPQRSIESIIRSWQGTPQTEIDIAKNTNDKNYETKKDSGYSIKDKEQAESIKSTDALNTFDAFDAFINRSKNNTFSVTCMAFQDVHTLDLERLQRCCVHVYDGQNKLIPFCAYNLTSLDGISLYRNPR